MSLASNVPTAFPEVGQAIPDTAHAVSVSLPSWKANVGYEKGEEWVISKMKNGYPRFFVHLSIQALASAVAERYGSSNEMALLFPSASVAQRCTDFILKHAPSSRDVLVPEAENNVRIVDLILQIAGAPIEDSGNQVTLLSAVLYPKKCSTVASKFWQHWGDGISSRRADFFQQAFNEGHLVQRTRGDADVNNVQSVQKGPRRYQRAKSTDLNVSSAKSESLKCGPNQQPDNKIMDHIRFVEERFGRNLDLTQADHAKIAIRRRIAGSLTASVDIKHETSSPEHSLSYHHGAPVSEDDIYLFPTGMSAISNAHRMILKARGPMKSVMFGFPYIDTLKVLEKFGPGVLFYGHGSSLDLDDLEYRCKKGERYLALFCEFPGNPLLKTPDLRRIRKLADAYDFAVVVDETIGNFLNINALPAADVVVSSLTKVFSGDSNVMGGSCVLNATRKYYAVFNATFLQEYEDNYWPEDAIFMERNSRDFISRNGRINRNAEAVCELLVASPHVKEVFYPKYSQSKDFFDEFKNANGGYGGLLSITFHLTSVAMEFFDTLETAKGPSLGTNFTLSCPFVLLAHYNELDWAAQFGAEPDLVRISIGLEEPTILCSIIEQALAKIST